MAELAVGPNRLGEAVSRALGGYSQAVTDAVDAESAACAKRLVRATRATAPRGSRRRGSYRSSISSRLLARGAFGDTYVWYVRKPNYRLSHLLERDHATGGPSNRGRARGTRFISAAWAREEAAYVRGVREAIRRASR